MRGHLVLADISGYTRFLTVSELEHANGIIGELLNAVIAAIEAPLTVSRIEGDAVFMYGVMPEGTSGETVLESVELLYISFARALEIMVLNTSCPCNACANINTLGLKIVMHCGEIAKTTVGGMETLAGPDVVVAHRLLKNSIRDTIGIDDYLLVTQACVDDLGIQRIVTGWVAHTEEYEHVGEVTGYVSSLSDVWEFSRRQNDNKVLQADAFITLSAYSKAPPAVVWDHLVNPIKRTGWLNAESNEVENETGGRIGPGAEYHCSHGADVLFVFTVLDRRPVDYLTLLLPVADGVALRFTDYLIPSGQGTRIVSCFAPAFSVETGEVVPDDVLSAIEAEMGPSYQASLDRLVEMADRAAEELASV